MKFCLCHLVIIDNGTPFKCDFAVKCKALDLNYDILTKRNYEGLTVEHVHRFFKNVVTISTRDQQSNDVFVPSGITMEYSWNSAPVDKIINYVILLLLTVNSGFQLKLIYQL